MQKKHQYIWMKFKFSRQNKHMYIVKMYFLFVYNENFQQETVCCFWS